jgi:proton glutamate symport protein
VKTGLAALGGLAHYIASVSAVGLLVGVSALAVARLGGGLRLAAFLRAVAPAQAVAISTQSSLASLPAMLRSAGALGVPAPRADVTLPLAVALFRVTGPAMNLAVAIYVAHLFGIVLAPTTLAMGVAVAATATLATVSLPGTISFITSVAPIAAAMGVPLAPLALLVAVETLPDIIRTVGNVTMDVAVTAAVSRAAGEES